MHPYLDPKNPNHWWEATNRHVPGHDTKRQRAVFAVEVAREVRRAGQAFFLALHSDGERDWHSWGIAPKGADHGRTLVFLSEGYTLAHAAHKLGCSDSRLGWQAYWGWQ